MCEVPSESFIQVCEAAAVTHLLKEFMPGDNATIRVPEFDRGPTDPKNLIVVILEKIQDFHTLGCKAGILCNKYTASDLDPVAESLLLIEDVPELTLPLKTAVGRTTGGQGYTKCSSKKGCSSGRCSCKRHNLSCNSRCHPGVSCNHHE